MHTVTKESEIITFLTIRIATNGVEINVTVSGCMVKLFCANKIATQQKKLKYINIYLKGRVWLVNRLNE